MVGVLDDFDGCIEENGANGANGGCDELAAEQEGRGRMGKRPENGERTAQNGERMAQSGKGNRANGVNF